MNDPAASAIGAGSRSDDRLVRNCDGCGALRPVTSGGKSRSRCAMCHVREGPRRLCARCGRVLGPVRKPVEGYTGLTWACWWEPIGICHRCRPEGMCTALRDGEYQCLRCELAVGLHKLLLLRSIRPVPPWFLPLRDAILTIPNPRFGLTGVGPAIRALEDRCPGTCRCPMRPWTNSRRPRPCGACARCSSPPEPCPTQIPTWRAWRRSSRNVAG